MTLQHTTEEILNNEDTQYYPTSNRNVKDRLFRFIFQDKKDLLDLYNAVNQSDYTNIDDFEVNTLDDAIYLSMKNDISFLIGGTMNLYEHRRRLEEYSIFIHTIRKYQKIYDNIHKAVSSAVDDCIENNILKDILNKHKSEVISMVLTTFDQALYERDIRADGYEDGFNDGLSQSIQFVIKTLQESSISKEKIVSKLIENFPSIDSQTLEKYVNEFWK